MNIGEIIKDSIKYPLSDWKKFFILGIMLLIGNLYFDIGPVIQNIVLIIILLLLFIIFILLVNGYMIRIIESSLNGKLELPDFYAWGTMLIDGFKLSIVTFIYTIPSFIIVFFAEIFYRSILSNISPNLSNYDASTLLNPMISYGSILFNIGSNLSNYDASIFLNLGILILIAFLYLLIVAPIVLMAVANMAYNDCKFSAAFKFGEIFNKIKHIGKINLIRWYIVTVTIYVVLLLVGSLIIGFLSHISYIIAGLLSLLVLATYLNIYLFRSVALIYTSEENL